MEADFNPVQVQVVAFDLFGTIFKLDRPYTERKAYADHIKKESWAPLVLPKEWGELEPYEDAAEGMRIINEECRHWTVTLSNAPMDVQGKLLSRYRDEDGLGWFDQYVDLARWEVFKPHREAYITASLATGVLPSKILLVTANEEFGDLEGARSWGMQAQLIDRENKYGGKKPRTLIELAKLLGKR